MFTIGETRPNCDANEPKEDAQGIDSPREIKQPNSAQAAKEETLGNPEQRQKTTSL